VLNSPAIGTNPQTQQQLRLALSRISNQLTALRDAAGLDSFTFSAATVKGQPVYVSAADTLALADADTVTTSNVVGLAFENVGAGAAGRVQSSGIVNRQIGHR
jgi:hypothetical protein